MCEWQPIETAPKDGTIIQGWWAGKISPGEVWPIRYVVTEDGSQWIGWSPGLGEVRISSMTHWKPLSKPPEK